MWATTVLTLRNAAAAGRREAKATVRTPQLERYSYCTFNPFNLVIYLLLFSEEPRVLAGWVWSWGVLAPGAPPIPRATHGSPQRTIARARGVDSLSGPSGTPDYWTDRPGPAPAPPRQARPRNWSGFR